MSVPARVALPEDIFEKGKGTCLCCLNMKIFKHENRLYSRCIENVITNGFGCKMQMIMLGKIPKSWKIAKECRVRNMHWEGEESESETGKVS